MRARSAVATGCLAAVLVASPVPGAAEPGHGGPPAVAGDTELALQRSLAASPTPLAVQRADAGTVVATPDHGRPMDLARRLVAPAEPGAPRDGSAFGAVMRRHVEAAWGIDLGQNGTGRSDHEDEFEQLEPYTAAWAYPGGDLSGDGVDDLLVSHFSYPEEELGLSARRGLDGEALWQETGLTWDEAFPLPLGDRTGDGVADLLDWLWVIHDVTWSDSCDGDTCTYDTELAYTWTLRVRSGDDGSVVWQRDWPGLAYFHETHTGGPAWRYAYEVTAEHGLVLPLRSGDHDGDGLADLIVNDYSFTASGEAEGVDAIAVWTDAGMDTFRGDSVAEIVRGATGEPVAVYTSLDAPGLGLLEPYGEADLLWQELVWEGSTHDCVAAVVVWHCLDEPELDIALRVTPLSGDTLASRWSREFDGLVYGFAAPVEADLDGDGVEDAAVFTIDEDWDFTTAVLDGADGATRWSVDRWGWPNPVGSIDGGAGADVVLLGANILWEWGYDLVEGEQGRTEIEVFADRRDGASGAPFGASVRRGEWDELIDLGLFLDLLGDADGDGVDDVALGYLAWPSSGAVTDGGAESGRDSAVLVDVSGPGSRYLDGAGDLDVDGLGDALVGELPADFWDDPLAAIDYTALRLVDGAALWQASAWWLFATADLSGDGGPDLLEFTPVFTDRQRDRITVREGATAAERWSIVP